MTSVSLKFFMVALPGERHEDRIPQGLYTLSGFRKFIKKQMKVCVDEGFEYYIFVMAPDSEVSGQSDCDHVIIFGGSKSLYLDDKELSLSYILDVLERG